MKSNSMDDYEHLAFYLKKKNKISDVSKVANRFDTNISGLMNKYEYLLKIMLNNRQKSV